MVNFLAMAPAGLKMALLGAVVIAMGGFYWHYTSVKQERNDALALVGAMEVAKATQDATIKSLEGAITEWADQAKKMQATLEELSRVQQEATAQQRRLNDVLGKHDLERLSEAKPVLIERRINSGTADVFRMFECATGGCDDGSG